MKRVTRAILLTILPALLGACTTEPPTEQEQEPQGTALELIVPAQSVNVGDDAILRADLRDADGAALAGRSVTFSVNGREVGQASTDAAGRASMRFAPANAGVQAVEVRYAGDDDYEGSDDRGNFDVARATSPLAERAGSAISLSLPAELRVGDRASLGARLVDDAGKPLADRVVVFTVYGQPAGNQVTDRAGEIAIPFEARNAGTFEVRARFDGDKNNRAAGAAARLRITERAIEMPTQLALSLPEEPVQAGDMVSIQARISAERVLISDGFSVTFLLNGEELGSAETDVRGVATIEFEAPGAGAHSVQAQFAGDAQYAPSSAAGTLDVDVAEEPAATVTGIYYSEMVGELAEPDDTKRQIWILWRLEIESGDRTELARAEVTETWQHSDRGPPVLIERNGEKPKANVIDGKLYINGALADAIAGGLILDESGEEIPEPRGRFASRMVEETVRMTLGGQERELGTRTWLVIDERDPETGRTIREAARQLRGSTVAEADLDDIKEQLHALNLLNPREFATLQALVDDDRQALQEWRGVSEEFAADGNRLFFRKEADAKIEILMIDIGARDPRVRSLRTIDVPGGDVVNGLKVSGASALITFEGKPSLYIDLSTGAEIRLGFEADAVLPSSQP
ncbi:MAG: Ig-like domain repeat protein [Planctomycetota bacterium]